MAVKLGYQNRQYSAFDCLSVFLVFSVAMSVGEWFMPGSRLDSSIHSVESQLCLQT